MSSTSVSVGGIMAASADRSTLLLLIGAPEVDETAAVRTGAVAIADDPA